MEFKTNYPTRLYHVMKGVSPYLESVNIEYNAEGLSFQAMDASHVCLIRTTISKEEGTLYRTKDGYEEGIFGILLKSLVKVLRHATSSDTLSLSYNPLASRQALVVELKGDDRTMSVSIPCMDIDEDSLGVPEMDYKFQIQMIPKVWDGYVSAFDVIDPYNITICPIHEDTTCVELQGEGEMGPMTMKVRADRPLMPDSSSSDRRDLTRYTKILKSSCEEELKITLAYNMVAQMSGLSKVMTKVTVSVDEGVPARFFYASPGNTMTVEAYIAPKLMDDDDD